jgi:uncharacterized repeat protein (TIGR04076 family)
VDPEKGFKVECHIKSVKGYCAAGHKPGEVIHVGARRTGNICGYLYHTAHPYITMLQFGGNFPATWGDTEKVEIDCIDKGNLVTAEFRRVKTEPEKKP